MHLEDAVREARRVLLKAGMPQDSCLQVAADAGYGAKADLVFAQREASWVDVLVAEPLAAGEQLGAGGLYGRNDFVLDAHQRSVVCPVGRKMHGPSYDKAHGYDRYVGVGCKDCPLKPKCTRGQQRNVTVDWDFEQARAAMRQRMAQRGAKERYNRRIATVEPVFSSLEDSMGFRRVSSRLPQTVKAEVLLKLLAHNISRLITRQRLVLVLFRLLSFWPTL